MKGYMGSILEVDLSSGDITPREVEDEVYEKYLSGMGLGACWVGYLMLAATQYEPLKDALGIPNDHRLYGAMVVGYPKYSYRRIPPRNQAKVVML